MQTQHCCGCWEVFFKRQRDTQKHRGRQRQSFHPSQVHFSNACNGCSQASGWELTPDLSGRCPGLEHHLLPPRLSNPGALLWDAALFSYSLGNIRKESPLPSHTPLFPELPMRSNWQNIQLHLGIRYTHCFSKRTGASFRGWSWQKPGWRHDLSWVGGIRWDIALVPSWRILANRNFPKCRPRTQPELLLVWARNGLSDLLRL